MVWMIDQENVSLNRMEQTNARIAMAIPEKTCRVFFISASLMIGASLQYNPTIGHTNDLLAEGYAKNSFAFNTSMTFNRMDIEVGAWRPIVDYEKDFVMKHKANFFLGVNNGVVLGLVNGILDDLDFVDLGKRPADVGKIKEDLFDTGKEYAKGSNSSKKSSQSAKKDGKEKLTPEQVLNIVYLMSEGKIRWLDCFIGGRNNLEKLLLLYFENKAKFDEFFANRNMDIQKAVFSIIVKDAYYLNEDKFFDIFSIPQDKTAAIGTMNLDFYWHLAHRGYNVTLFDIEEFEVWSLFQREFLRVNFQIEVKAIS